jgi:hypothetical protein
MCALPFWLRKRAPATQSPGLSIFPSRALSMAQRGQIQPQLPILEHFGLCKFHGVSLTVLFEIGSARIHAHAAHPIFLSGRRRENILLHEADREIAAHGVEVDFRRLADLAPFDLGRSAAGVAEDSGKMKARLTRTAKQLSC